MVLQRNRQLFLFAVTMFFAVMAVSRAYAFGVTPMLVEADVERGVTYNGTIAVFSNTKEVEQVKVSIADWDKKPNGDDTEFEPGTLERSCSKWINIGPTKFDVPVDQWVNVRYSFTVPDDAIGSYWTFAIVEADKKPSKPSESNGKIQTMIETSFRYIVRIVVTVDEGRVYDGKINGISVFKPAPDSQFKDFPSVARVVFENTGNVLLKPQGYVDIRNLDGETVEKVEIQPKSYVIPERERWLDVPVKKNLENGEYIAVAVLDYGGDNLVAGEAHFTAPPPEQPQDEAKSGPSGDEGGNNQ